MDPKTQALIHSLQPRPGESVPDWKSVTADKPTMDVSLLRELTTLKDVPEDFKKFMWSFMSQEDVWGNMDEKDIRMAEEYFLAAWDFYEFALPNDAEPQMSLHFLNAIHKFRLRMTRAKDGFERKQENTTIAQTMTPQRSVQQGNWFKRVFNKFGF